MDFDKLARLFVPLTVSGVLKAKRHSYDRFVERIGDLEFVTRSINYSSQYTVVQLQIIDEDLLYQLLSGEANKFWLASMFSLNRARQDQSGNAAWQAVEHYYAAYYAVHYLLRVSGVSLTNFDSRAISAVQENSLGDFTSAVIPSGLYVLNYNESTKTLTLRKNSKKSTGGSHRDAWRLWDELVEKLQREAESDVVEYADISIELSAHRAYVVKSTDQYSPPEVRGEMNYQFKGNVWIFEKNSAKAITHLQNFISLPPTSPERTADNVRRLISNNKLIIELARLIFITGANTYPGSICRSLVNKYSTQLKSELSKI